MKHEKVIVQGERMKERRSEGRMRGEGRMKERGGEDEGEVRGG